MAFQKNGWVKNYPLYQVFKFRFKHLRFSVIYSQRSAQAAGLLINGDSFNFDINLVILFCIAAIGHINYNGNYGSAAAVSLLRKSNKKIELSSP